MKVDCEAKSRIILFEELGVDRDNPMKVSHVWL